MSPRGRRRLHVVVLTASLLAVSSGCETGTGSRSGGVNPILGDGITDDFDAVAFLDPEVRGKVDDCVETARFKVYVGDDAWREVWTRVGESDDGLREHCETLASRDPDALDRIHDEWVAWEEFVAADPG